MSVARKNTIPTITPLPMVLPYDENGHHLLETVAELTPLTDLILPPTTRRQVDRVLTEHLRSAELAQLGLQPSKRLLFYGPPGCGKTASAGAIALALGRPLVRARLDGLISSYLGVTSKNLRKIFDMVREQKVVMLLDEFDAIARDRGATDRSDVAEIKRIVNSLLVMLEQITGDSIIIAATNHEATMDGALWRRFDEVVEFPRPSGEHATALLWRVLERHRLTLEGGGKAWPRKLAGMSFADVERVALEAVKAVALSDGALSAGHALASALLRQRERAQLGKRQPRRSR